ncbi:hypothetical protein [Thermococcus sp. GR6]|nr:hypothetical protein [Thermococcus sp. GR6]
MGSEPLTGFHILGPLIGLFLILGAVVLFLVFLKWFWRWLRR